MKNQSNLKSDVNTLEITDFTGRLTRKLNGKMNSGFAKFDTSWGYDPFSKPGNLTWFETPVDLDSTDAVIGLTIVAGKTTLEGTNQGYLYAIGANYSNGAKLFKIQPNSLANPNLDSVIGITTLTNNSFLFGGSMEFFGSTSPNSSSVISFTTDGQLVYIRTDGTGETVKATLSQNTYHPLTKFVGKLIVGDKYNLTTIDGSGVAVSSILSPSLPPETFIRDLSTNPEGTFATVASSIIPPARQDYGYDRINSAAGYGYVFNWNGVDTGITNYKTFPSHAITGFKTYMSNQFLFSNDSFGMSLSNGDKKVRTLQNNSAIIPNAITSNGNFVSWMATESVDSTMKASMYYYGSLDEENPSGLWRMFRMASSINGGFVYTCPFNMLVEDKFTTLNSAETATALFGYGKHYFSTYEIPSGGGTSKYKLYRFLVTSSGTGTPNLGVWESQTELFGKKVSLNEIRVYCEPTVANNGFQLDVIGTDGNVVANGTFTYTFGDIKDVSGSSVVDRINFNPGVINLYGIGIRITNTGTKNMTIKKVEVDTEPSGK